MGNLFNLYVADGENMYNEIKDLTNSYITIPEFRW